jgi:hypothetical protein
MWLLGVVADMTLANIPSQRLRVRACWKTQRLPRQMSLLSCM